MWEPLIEELWAVGFHNIRVYPEFYIREMWSIEWQSHGQSALLNEGKGAAKKCRKFFKCSLSHSGTFLLFGTSGVRDYGSAISDFVNSHWQFGEEGTVIAVGYSAGAVAL